MAALILLIGTAAFAQQRGGTPEERAQRLTDRMKSNLNLTDEQYKQVYEINLKMAGVLEEIDKDNKNARQNVKAEYEKQLATVLNKEQLEKVKELRRQRRGKMKTHKGQRMHQNRNNN